MFHRRSLLENEQLACLIHQATCIDVRKCPRRQCSALHVCEAQFAAPYCALSTAVSFIEERRSIDTLILLSRQHVSCSSLPVPSRLVL
jgi:hypothetical protein